MKIIVGYYEVLEDEFKYRIYRSGGIQSHPARRFTKTQRIILKPIYKDLGPGCGIRRSRCEEDG